jgi:peptidyl-prolyl cis-trans isomerase SurA
MKIFKVVLAGVAAVFLCTSAQGAVANRIVAIVNDEVITLSELNDAFEPYQAQIEEALAGEAREKTLSENKLMLLNRMIDNLLLEQESRKSGITVREEDVTGAIKDLLEKKKLSQNDFLKALMREGTTLEAYRKGLRAQLMRMRLIRREIQSKVAVTDEEIGEYYRKHREDYEGKEAVRLKQIILLLPKGENQDLKDKLRAAAEAIHQRLLAGEPFDLLSAQNSQGPAAAAGGDIGYIEKGVILPEVEEAAFSLALNQISGVIESPVGFHILQMIDRRGAGLKTIASVREEIREKIDLEKGDKRFGEWMEDLRKKSHIEIKLR